MPKADPKAPVEDRRKLPEDHGEGLAAVFRSIDEQADANEQLARPESVLERSGRREGSKAH